MNPCFVFPSGFKNFKSLIRNLLKTTRRTVGSDGVQTDWIPQVWPSAGEQKGFVHLPDVGELVLVLITRSFSC
jgi:phage baseplate assembly protein gpV